MSVLGGAIDVLPQEIPHLTRIVTPGLGLGGLLAPHHHICLFEERGIGQVLALTNRGARHMIRRCTGSTVSYADAKPFICCKTQCVRRARLGKISNI